MTQTQLRQRFQEAFDSFLARVKQDPSIVAVYLYGSLVRGDMWAGSDLDVYAITREERAPRKTLILIEHGITFHCDVVSRSQFRRAHERMLRGSIPHQVFTHGLVAYTTDESLHEYYAEMAQVGERDRALMAFYYGIGVISIRHSVRKSLFAHQDATYMFIWLLEAVRYLARVEVALQGENVQREALHQAARLNGAFFKPLLKDLLHGEKNLDSLQELLGRVEAYMQEKSSMIFKPILDYLQAEGEVRGMSEVHTHITRRLNLEENRLMLYDTCNWLIEIGLLEEVENPIKLTPKSRVTVNEPAYYYDGALR